MPHLIPSPAERYIFKEKSERTVVTFHLNSLQTHNNIVYCDKDDYQTVICFGGREESDALKYKSKQVASEEIECWHSYLFVFEKQVKVRSEVQNTDD